MLHLKFYSFDIENDHNCVYDVMKIYDGPDSSYTLVGSYCGTNKPPLVKSSTESLFIHFTTDGSQSGNGFKFFWQAITSDLVNGENHVKAITKFFLNRVLENMLSRPLSLYKY